MEIMIFIVVVLAIVLIVDLVVNIQRKKLLNEVLTSLNLTMINKIVSPCDRNIVVKSRQALENYTDLKFFKDYDSFEAVKAKSEARKKVRRQINSFLSKNEFESRKQYKYVAKQLMTYSGMANGYKVLVTYITAAGNNKGQKLIHITSSRIDELVAHPEIMMSKTEYNKLLKQQNKEALETKKHNLYDSVNQIIDYANLSKDELVVKSKVKDLDELVMKLYDKTVNSIQKISKIDGDEVAMIESFINSINTNVVAIVEDDKRISEYYKSDNFTKIKETCSLLTQSQKEFNEYISEKADSISKLFGTRVARNETENEDVYNYLRPYKKSITPFTAEVSAAVFSSAENDPIGYVIKMFYPSKSQYPEQLQRLRLLIEELETLKEAKVIIENYKKDYADYIKDVPNYILENDEAGFYSRLGLTLIDEATLNVCYKFVYTSGGGLAQRSFEIPMTEENITELIHQLESKLSAAALAKEQRALMTAKLRSHIKERDNYTCCTCGNSTHAEPNLLLEIDHIIPVAKGGLTEENNLQTLCWKCNRTKGAKLMY